jgi:hypothetical protein
MHTSNTCNRRRVVLLLVLFPVLCAMGFKGFDGVYWKGEYVVCPLFSSAP